MKPLSIREQCQSIVDAFIPRSRMTAEQLSAELRIKDRIRLITIGYFPRAYTYPDVIIDSIARWLKK